MTITPDQLRADIAEMLEVSADSIANDANLLDMGLDSMRAMNLAMQWEEQGLPLDFTDLATAQTLDDLWAVISARLPE